MTILMSRILIFSITARCFDYKNTCDYESSGMTVQSTSCDSAGKCSLKLYGSSKLLPGKRLCLVLGNNTYEISVKSVVSAMNIDSPSSRECVPNIPADNTTYCRGGDDWRVCDGDDCYYTWESTEFDEGIKSKCGGGGPAQMCSANFTELLKVEPCVRIGKKLRVHFEQAF